MDIDTTQLIVAVIRGVLVTGILYFFGGRINKYINSIPPKYKFLYSTQQKDRKLREFIVKYYWFIGLLVFLINILILYFLK